MPIEFVDSQMLMFILKAHVVKYCHYACFVYTGNCSNTSGIIQAVGILDQDMGNLERRHTNDVITLSLFVVVVW